MLSFSLGSSLKYIYAISLGTNIHDIFKEIEIGCEIIVFPSITFSIFNTFRFQHFPFSQKKKKKIQSVNEENNCAASAELFFKSLSVFTIFPFSIFHLHCQFQSKLPKQMELLVKETFITYLKIYQSNVHIMHIHDTKTHKP